MPCTIPTPCLKVIVPALPACARRLSGTLAAFPNDTLNTIYKNVVLAQHCLTGLNAITNSILASVVLWFWLWHVL